jgi:hypothetical protein
MLFPGTFLADGFLKTTFVYALYDHYGFLVDHESYGFSCEYCMELNLGGHDPFWCVFLSCNEKWCFLDLLLLMMMKMIDLLSLYSLCKFAFALCLEMKKITWWGYMCGGERSKENGWGVSLHVIRKWFAFVW